jgi:histidinol dehydrogenase
MEINNQNASQKSFSLGKGSRMRQYNFSDLSKADIDKLVLRNVDANNQIRESVENIIKEVKTNGDNALRSFTKKFDGVELETLFIDKNKIDELATTIPEKAKNAINIAYQNIKKFHENQI